MGYYALSALLLLYLANGYLLLAWSALTRGRRHRENRALFELGRKTIEESAWPTVLTQIPLYNESAVAARVIDAVAAFDYPAGRHRVQVLDDSTDETREIVDARAALWRERGVAIEVIRRPVRTGFKAGALRHGMEIQPSDCIAIFDADFIPPSDFLTQAVPLLIADPRAGWVQARWSHLNPDTNLLTRAQAIAIDAHFAVEQAARSAGLFMAFNGSAGVWKRRAIDEAGGWSDATLTEDLDLSCRAALCGWHGRLHHGLEVPAEVPGNAAAYQSQQFRWAKGTLQTALRILPRLWKSHLPSYVKVQATIQMTQYLLHPLLLVIALLTPWMAFHAPMASEVGISGSWQLLAGIALVGGSYFGGQVILRRPWFPALERLGALLIAGTSTMLGSTRAALEAMAGRRSEFIRTPKGGAGFASPVIPLGLELLFALYCVGGVFVCGAQGWWAAIPMLCFCASGCFTMILGQLAPAFHTRFARKPAAIGVAATKPHKNHGHASA